MATDNKFSITTPCPRFPRLLNGFVPNPPLNRAPDRLRLISRHYRSSSTHRRQCMQHGECKWITWSN